MSYNRKKTREVSLGNIKIGGDNPIAVQSMTTTDTRDAAKTIEQIKKLEEAVCDAVRVAVPDMKRVLCAPESRLKATTLTSSDSGTNR